MLFLLVRSGRPPEPPVASTIASPSTAAPVSPPTVVKPALSPRAAVPVAPAPPAPEKSVPAPTTGTIRFESDVPGASVFIDRVYLGTTPITVPNVTPGPRQITAAATGYDSLAETLDVVPGERDVLLEFKKLRLDARVEVIHKHGIGSCTGTLIATPQGIRYDTTNAGDRFDVPLSDPTTFELDFLAKNLRIKLSGGKTYNFTEPGGGADGLYGFHRAVEGARKKIK